MDGCIEWTGLKNVKGYGRRQGYKGREWFAHRAAWDEQVGSIPEGMLVLHRCDNPPCCNTDHLFLGTHEDNMHDMVNKGRGVTLRGVANPCGRLTASQVEQVRSMYRSGWDQHKIAAEFEVTQATISRVVRGVTYNSNLPIKPPVMTCRNCGKQQQRIPGNRRYCNASCRSNFRNANRRRAD